MCSNSVGNKFCLELSKTAHRSSHYSLPDQLDVDHVTDGKVGTPGELRWEAVRDAEYYVVTANWK